MHSQRLMTTLGLVFAAAALVSQSAAQIVVNRCPTLAGSGEAMTYWCVYTLDTRTVTLVQPVSLLTVENVSRGFALPSARRWDTIF